MPTVSRNNEAYDANVRVKDLPRWVDNTLTALAAHRRVRKHLIIRAALIHYAERFKEEAKRGISAAVDGNDEVAS